MSTMIFQAARAMWNDSIELHMAVKDEGLLSIARPVVLERASEAAISAPPRQLRD